MRTRCAATLLLLFVLPVMSSAGQADEPTVPDDVLSTLREGHPRLLMRPGGFKKLRQRAEKDDRLAGWLDQLRDRADEVLDKPPREYRIPDGKRLLGTSRRVLNRVRLLSLVYRLDGEKKHLRRAWEELNNAAQFKDWNPSHFLDTAEMTHAFAIGYDWLHDDLSESQRSTIREAIVELGLKPGLKCYRGEADYGWWTGVGHNWNQVCNGGLSMGALAIAEDRPDLAAEIVGSALKSFRRAMRQYAPDGGYVEGTSYWHYGTRYNVLLIDALGSALGTDFGYSGYEGFDQTGYFPIYMTGPRGRTFNFADASAHAPSVPEMFWLEQRFGPSVFGKYQLHRVRPRVLDVLWYPDGLGPVAELFGPPLPRDRYFAGPEAVTMRGAWGEKRASFVGFKAGSPWFNHNHADLGSFIFDALGRRWALDLGRDDYNMPGYFHRDGPRWDYYRMRAEGHNTLVLNPDDGPDQKPKAHTRIVRRGLNTAEPFAIADLTGAYEGQVASVKRGVKLVGRRDLRIRDEVSADEPAELFWFMHTKAEVELSDGGGAATLKKGDDRLRAEILAPKEARFEVRPAEPLPSSPDPKMQAGNKGVRKLTIHRTGVKKLDLVVRLRPVREDEPAPDPPKLAPLADW